MTIIHAATEGEDSTAEDMIRKKNKSRIQLEAVLSGRVDDLRFYEYNHLYITGSLPVEPAQPRSN